MAVYSSISALKAAVATLLPSAGSPKINAVRHRQALDNVIDTLDSRTSDVPDAPANQSTAKKYNLNVPASSGDPSWTEDTGGGGGSETGATIRDKLAGLTGSARLAASAIQGLFSGNYNDLTNKPSIPAAVSDASTTVKGKIEIATNTEVDTGTDTSRAVTPAGTRRATGAQISSAEKTAGSATTVRRFSPKDVHDMIDTHAPSGGGVSLSDDTPQDPGTASAGAGTEASRDDHVHNSDAP